MRIALDTNATYKTLAGTYRYIKGLQRGFERLESSPLEILPVAWPVYNLKYSQPTRAIKTAYREIVWEHLLASGSIRRLNADLYHDPASSLSRCPAELPRVTTVLDASVFRYPQRFRPWQRRREPIRLQAATRADRIITISQFSADEAIRFLGADPKKIDVVYLGSEFADVETTLKESAPAVPLPSEFLLFVGSLEPVKNLALLHDVWALAKSRHIELPPLIIVGARWEGVESENAPPPDWLYLGRESDAVLLYLLRRAQALVFPSKYEGFGLPVLEAMSTGCPVICSKVASIPEVGGTAVLYAKADADSYLDAIREVSTNATLRAELSAKGLRQAETFSWKSCAEQTAEVYRKCL